MTQTQLNDAGNQTIDDDAWTAAVEAIREDYDDTYGDRVELGADLARQVDDCPQEARSEAVLQPLIRYQQIDPNEVTNQLTNKFDNSTTTEIRSAIIEYSNQ